MIGTGGSGPAADLLCVCKRKACVASVSTAPLYDRAAVLWFLLSRNLRLAPTLTSALSQGTLSRVHTVGTQATEPQGNLAGDTQVLGQSAFGTPRVNTVSFPLK